jgi:hypothetical protein
MKHMNKLSLTVIAASLFSTLGAQGLNENFANVAGLTTAGWVISNQSAPIGTNTNGWNQGSATTFPAVDGVTGEYIAANFNATSGAGDISAWLVTPVVTLENGGILTFYTRTSPDDLYADRLEVRMSTNGPSSNTGSGATAVGDFTTTLLTINPTLISGQQAYPLTWTKYMVVISGLSAPVTGRFAFRYFVTNGGPSGNNSDLIGLDQVVYTPNCAVTPAAGALSENETCGQDLNGGCNSTTPVYVDLAPGCTTTYTGTSSAASGSRDTDWYRFTLTEPATVTMTFNARFPGLAAFTNGNCASLSILSAGENIPCQSLTVSHTFTAPGTYSAVILPSIFDGLACTSGLNNYNVTFTISSTVTATAAGPTSFCQGGSVQLNSSAASGNTWSNNATGNSITVNASGAYTVSTALGNGCSITSAPVNVTVNPLPTVTASSSPTTACNGVSVTLTGGGANTYSWDNGVQNGVAFTPASTLTYTVTGTDQNNCSNTASVTIPVGTNPTVSVQQSANSICEGANFTLTASGASTYTWDNGVQNGVAFPVQPITYTVIGYGPDGCTDTVAVTPNVNLAPVVAIQSSSNSVCQGSSVTLTASGTPTLTWNNNVQDGVAFTPAGTDTYLVIGTDGNGCSDTASVTITVNPLPMVNLDLGIDSVCTNNGLISLAGGSPSNGVFSGTGVTGTSFDPNTNPGNYVITYTFVDNNGCTGTATDDLMVVNCLGFADAQSMGITFGPNPTQGALHVQLPENWNQASVSIMDAQGRQMETFMVTGSFTKQMDRYASGVYFMQVNQGEQTATLRILVQ